jgi:hypothetical protein
MTKTPYEVRLDLLRMAQDQANARFYNQWEKALRKAERVQSEVPLNEAPEFPTAEQILAEAEKLKTFINNG